MLDNKLLNAIEEYCKFNKIEDIKGEVNRMLQIGFNVTKYGTSPFTQYTPPPKVEEAVEEEKKVKKRTVKKEVKEEVSNVEEKPKNKKIRIIKNS